MKKEIAKIENKQKYWKYYPFFRPGKRISVGAIPENNEKGANVKEKER
jgi:hypothetical protein